MKKVKIYTFSDKAPYFIPWQFKSFKDHIQDDFEYIVMNNSSSATLDADIKNHCSSLAIQCIDVENKDFSHACFSCSEPIQECIDKYISKDKEYISVIADSDLFLMRDFSFNDYMEGWDIAGLPQSRDTGGGNIIEYLWNCLIIINTTAPNISKLKMWPGVLNHGHCDVGMASFFYLLYNDVKFKRIPTTNVIISHPEVLGLIPERVRDLYELRFDSEIIEGSFFHFRGGSRWDSKPSEYYESKEIFVQKLLEI